MSNIPKTTKIKFKFIFGTKEFTLIWHIMHWCSFVWLCSSRWKWKWLIVCNKI